MNHGWIGVDLDGTLAQYDGFRGRTHIGPPVPLMLTRVKAWIAEGWEVRIVTARAVDHTAAHAIHRWLVDNGLPILRVTDKKDFEMIELWDDRAVQVKPNTGERADGLA